MSYNKDTRTTPIDSARKTEVNSVACKTTMMQVRLFVKQCSQNIVVNHFRSNPGRIERNKLNFYFHTSLWWLKKFYEDLSSWNLLMHYKEVWKWKFNFIFISIQLSEMLGTGRVNMGNICKLIDIANKMAYFGKNLWMTWRMWDIQLVGLGEPFEKFRNKGRRTRLSVIWGTRFKV